MKKQTHNNLKNRLAYCVLEYDRKTKQQMKKNKKKKKKTTDIHDQCWLVGWFTRLKFHS